MPVVTRSQAKSNSAKTEVLANRVKTDVLTEVNVDAPKVNRAKTTRAKSTESTVKKDKIPMTDYEKLEVCEKKLKNATFDLFSKRITPEEYANIVDKYILYVSYYRNKLNKPDLFASTDDDDDDDELL